MSVKNIAIVLSGGTGKRMGSNTPKQYLMLSGKEALYYPLKCIQDSFMDEIILVTGENYVDFCKETFKEKYGISKIRNIVVGGSERYESVINGLKAIEMTKDDEVYVYIHDGARVCLNNELLLRCKNDVIKYKACVPAIPVKDTIKQVDEEGFVCATPNRNTLRAVQTPQCFSYELINSAYSKLEEALAKGVCEVSITDDAMVYENFEGGKVWLSVGDEDNLKITTPGDLLIAERLLN